MTNSNIQLDIRGQICPSCLLMALKAVNENAAALRSGTLDIEIMTDDRQATATIPVTTGRMGFASEVERDGSTYRIRIFSAG